MSFPQHFTLLQLFTTEQFSLVSTTRERLSVAALHLSVYGYSYKSDGQHVNPWPLHEHPTIFSKVGHLKTQHKSLRFTWYDIKQSAPYCGFQSVLKSDILHDVTTEANSTDKVSFLIYFSEKLHHSGKYNKTIFSDLYIYEYSTILLETFINACEFK